MKQMKKLMVIAAAASLAAAAEAGIAVNTNCHPRSATCPVVAFKVTANGKVVAPVEKKDTLYKSVSKLSIKKGALVMFGADQYGDGTKVAQGDCCYEAYSLYLQVKVNKETIPVGVFYENIDSWSIFGKEYQNYLEAEKSKKFKVDSELGIAYANLAGGNGNGGSAINTQAAGNDSLTGNALGLDIEDDVSFTDFAFIATAFGKGTYKYSYSESGNACSLCVSESSDFTPGNYSGWFAGYISDVGGDYGCFLCDCNDLDVFGGTWKAKYNKSWSKNAEGWEKAAAYVFGSATVADMVAANIE